MHRRNGDLHGRFSYNIHNIIKYHITICTAMQIMELVFTTCTYNHHTVTVGQYQGTLVSCHTVNITCYTLLVAIYQGNKIYIFIFLNT